MKGENAFKCQRGGGSESWGGGEFRPRTQTQSLHAAVTAVTAWSAHSGWRPRSQLLLQDQHPGAALAAEVRTLQGSGMILVPLPNWRPGLVPHLLSTSYTAVTKNPVLQGALYEHVCISVWHRGQNTGACWRIKHYDIILSSESELN